MESDKNDAPSGAGGDTKLDIATAAAGTLPTGGPVPADLSIHPDDRVGNPDAEAQPETPPVADEPLEEPPARQPTPGSSEPGFVPPEPPEHEEPHPKVRIDRLHALIDMAEAELGAGKTWIAREMRLILNEAGAKKSE